MALSTQLCPGVPTCAKHGFQSPTCGILIDSVCFQWWVEGVSPALSSSSGEGSDMLSHGKQHHKALLDLVAFLHSDGGLACCIVSVLRE